MAVRLNEDKEIVKTIKEGLKNKLISKSKNVEIHVFKDKLKKEEILNRDYSEEDINL